MSYEAAHSHEVSHDEQRTLADVKVVVRIQGLLVHLVLVTVTINL